MNDLVYYLGIATGGHLGKQIAYLGAISAMAKGMTYTIKNEEDVSEIEAFISAVDMLDKAYVPSFDTNPYLFHKARRIRKGIQVIEAFAYHLLTKHELIAGNVMRARLAEQFGKGRILQSDSPEGYDDLG